MDDQGSKRLFYIRPGWPTQTTFYKNALADKVKDEFGLFWEKDSCFGTVVKLNMLWLANAIHKFMASL